MRTITKRVRLLPINTLIRAFIISVLFAAFFVASLYMLINSPA